MVESVALFAQEAISLQLEREQCAVGPGSPLATHEEKVTPSHVCRTS